jgi:hypothetical protein
MLDVCACASSGDDSRLPSALSDVKLDFLDYVIAHVMFSLDLSTVTLTSDHSIVLIYLFHSCHACGARAFQFNFECLKAETDPRTTIALY